MYCLNQEGISYPITVKVQATVYIKIDVLKSIKPEEYIKGLSQTTSKLPENSQRIREMLADWKEQVWCLSLTKRMFGRKRKRNC